MLLSVTCWGSRRSSFPRVSGIFTLVAFPITEAVYLAITWSKSGRSVGKKIVGLRVVRNEGVPLGLRRSTPRAILCALWGGPSLLWSAFSSRNAAVHDLVLHTTVVHDWSDEVRTQADARDDVLSSSSSATSVSTAPELPVSGTTLY